EVALSRSRSPEEYRETIESSLEECGRLSRLTTELLFLARAESDHPPIERKPIDVREMADEVRSFYEVLAEERGVKLTCSGSATTVASPELLRRALFNLVSNAMKYTAPGGRVDIALERTTGAALIRVCDDGAGVAAEHLPHLFDRFYRADASR